ncbi:UDP-N-acetylmuramate dehydrogenase [Alicyclobacillus fastidiosus]|uniref:UDP-N-acetylenolpyruvoylglucosamine reductase n=1 Tax=Alicyclobacillus fastidiosus TaxID=392011 RepID=A0ABY6ZE80_9BACL|nr:UDP-N-acetylmuramate dehydrogenase [Alicyclobacillus fastidiosus]WAH40436.1 UDP-N-acetylmuramate dehydrogenase [Alicyclobacillus fastidiosus]GMA61836.1 UDP-N-acetylenolpyruvoylglucosamine reductase [Alicyclobacillus fastidiosus]
MVSETLLPVFSSYGVKDVRLNESMANHTTWRIGGPADALVVPTTEGELQGAVRAANELNLPVTVIGRGSNALVLDGGIRGVVVKLHDGFGDIQVDGTSVVAMAGRSYVSAANIAVRHGLSGLEFATGIPGTVGGAVMMNAGAYGRETCEVLTWADVMDAKGDIHRYANADLHFGYRYSILKDHPGIVVRARFDLVEGDRDALMAKVKGWSARRAGSQPLSWPNCGSVFRNPEGTHAGHLIETAGLKGLRHGGAQISEKHANFIINCGDAKAEDVLWLIRHAQMTIRDKFGIDLETEVRFLGEPASGR